MVWNPDYQQQAESSREVMEEMAEEIEKLRALVAEQAKRLREMTKERDEAGWKPIESHQRDGTDFLAWNREGRYVEMTSCDDARIARGEFSLWCPLPFPSKEML